MPDKKKIQNPRAEAIDVESDVSDPFGVTGENVKPAIVQTPTLPCISDKISEAINKMCPPCPRTAPLVISARRTLDTACKQIMQLSIEDFAALEVSEQQELLCDAAEGIKDSLRQDGPIRVGFHTTKNKHLDSLGKDINTIETFEVGGEMTDDIDAYFFNYFLRRGNS